MDETRSKNVDAFIAKVQRQDDERDMLKRILEIEKKERNALTEDKKDDIGFQFATDICDTHSCFYCSVCRVTGKKLHHGEGHCSRCENKITERRETKDAETEQINALIVSNTALVKEVDELRGPCHALNMALLKQVNELKEERDKLKKECSDLNGLNATVFKRLKEILAPHDANASKTKTRMILEAHERSARNFWEFIQTNVTHTTTPYNPGMTLGVQLVKAENKVQPGPLAPIAESSKDVTEAKD